MANDTAISPATITAGTAANRYLEGNFAPVAEELTAVGLDVTGTIPEHLDGRYLRNGPNPIAPDPASHHWFMGDGMVHGLRLRDGRAEWYRNRWVRSAAVAAHLDEPPRPGPVLDGMDFAANTYVIDQGGRIFAIVEGGPRPYELTPDLDTVGPCDFEGTLPSGYTAHPKRDPATGELHAVGYFFGLGNKVQYTVLGTDARIRKVVEVEVTGSPMMHDFSLTENHVVLYDLPVRFDLEMAATSSFPYRWDPDYPARVGVMPRDGDGTDVTWYDVEPCYVFHPMNAYEDGSAVVLDVVRHPKVFDTHRLGPDEGPPALHRWTLRPEATAVTEECLDDRAQEFPRVDERRTGQAHRIGYSVGADSTSSSSAASGIFPPAVVVRHDFGTGVTGTRSFGPGTAVDEFVFVPSRDDAPEGDGVLMGFVYRGETDRSDLAILDAGTLETVALVHLPARVPHGFHGSWVPAP